jgi:hypothetical protein
MNSPLSQTLTSKPCPKRAQITGTHRTSGSPVRRRPFARTRDIVNRTAGKSFFSKGARFDDCVSRR